HRAPAAHPLPCPEPRAAEPVRPRTAGPRARPFVPAAAGRPFYPKHEETEPSRGGYGARTAGHSRAQRLAAGRPSIEPGGLPSAEGTPGAEGRERGGPTAREEPGSASRPCRGSDAGRAGPGSAAGTPQQPCRARGRRHGRQIKPCSELSFPVKIYFCVTILSLLSVIGLTIETLVRQAEEDFTISFIQLVGAVFCVYYVSRGILQENRQELVVFVLSVLLLMLRSITNFSLLPAGQKPQLLARFVLILLVGSFDVVCALVLMQSQSLMAFRVGGALESLQAQYFMLNLCFSMLTFDLQAQLCLCILLISLHEVTLLHNILSATGVLWGCLKVTVGITAILKELKPLVWVFLMQNVPEVVYLIYLLYTVIREWGKGNSYTLEAAFITGSCISVTIKSVLLWALLHVYRSFGQGLRERMFSSYGRIDS
uniref:DUF7789 domain-containing protein n=1 Tax=Junco hyemalis TaxID=40217 RepID=A0A8C5J683_JUNHY